MIEQPRTKLCTQLHDANLTKLTIKYLQGTVCEYINIKNKKEKKVKKRNFNVVMGVLSIFLIS